MRIGFVTDGLADLKLDTMLRTVAELRISMVEFGCGNWSSAPHLDLDGLLASDRARADFQARLAAHGLSISALNCSGNPLHPDSLGEAHRLVTGKTIRLAGLLGVRRVVMMSGCPGGPGDANANWITTAWPPACWTGSGLTSAPVSARIGARSPGERRGPAMPGTARPAERV